MGDGYQVIDQRQTMELGAGGRFHEVWEITYRTVGGVVGSVRIPKDIATPAYVAQTLAAEAAQADAIRNL